MTMLFLISQMKTCGQCKQKKHHTSYQSNCIEEEREINNCKYILLDIKGILYNIQIKKVYRYIQNSLFAF